MLSNIRIIHAKDFIKSTPEGPPDLERSKKLLLEIASASALSADYAIILDSRKAETVLSVSDVWYLATELSKYRKAFSRMTAVICPREEFDHAAFFALCSQNRGFNISAFISFEDAIEWLTADGS